MFEDEAKFVKDYNDGYFFTDPALFVKTHYPLDEEWKLLNKESFTIEQFINAPIIYGHTFKHKIIPIEPKTINNEVLTNEAVLFKFKVFDKNQIAKLKLEVNSGWKNKTLMLSDYKYSNNILQFKHTFNKKGLYDVHLKIDTKVIASYTVKVLKTRDK